MVGQVRWQVGDLVGDDVVVGEGLQRKRDTVCRGELASPHPRAVDDDLGLDVAHESSSLR